MWAFLSLNQNKVEKWLTLFDSVSLWNTSYTKCSVRGITESVDKWDNLALIAFYRDEYVVLITCRLYRDYEMLAIWMQLGAGKNSESCVRWKKRGEAKEFPEPVAAVQKMRCSNREELINDFFVMETARNIVATQRPARTWNEVCQQVLSIQLRT